jgi:hypothetical protein
MDDIVHLVFWLEIETNTVEIPSPTQTPCDAAKSRSEFLQDVLGASFVVVAHGSAEEPTSDRGRKTAASGQSRRREDWTSTK